MKKIKFSINGIEKECEILYTFKSDNTNKNYLICTDNTIENEKLSVYSFIYYPNDKSKGVERISKDEDWQEVENFINLVGGNL